MKYSKSKIKLLFGYFLSEYDKKAWKDLGFKNFKETCIELGKLVGANYNSMKNCCDEFHPITHSRKKGWWKVPTRTAVKIIKSEFDKWKYEDLLKEIQSILLDINNFLVPSSRLDDKRFTFESIIHDMDSVKSDPSIPKTERKTHVLSRIGQGKYREQLLIKYGKSCAVTGIETEDVLIASHIRPWCDCDPFQRIDCENGILLSSNLDKLFDHGIITFDDNGVIIISDILSQKEIKRLQINKNLKINLPLSGKQKQYLAYHREFIFKTY